MIAPLAASTSPLVVHERYHIVRTLGSGAQSTVFLVHDRALDQWRALKIASIGADPSTRARFEREARLMARLSHPNVVQIFDVTEIAGWPAIVMELARGGSVSGWMRRHGAVPTAWAIDVALQCAAALEHAHASGILHRDVKPANVLLHADGTISLADFGIAWCEGEAVHLTADGAVLGTLAYMAPEQRSGGRLDARTDVYALGAMLYTIATARRETELFLCVDRPAMLEGVDPTVAEVVLRCCRYDPADRLGSMGELRNLLAQLRRRCPPVPERVPPLGSAAFPLPDHPPLRTEHDFHVHQLRMRIALAGGEADDDTTQPSTPLDVTEDPDEPRRAPVVLPFEGPRLDRGSLPDPWSEDEAPPRPTWAAETCRPPRSSREDEFVIPPTPPAPIAKRATPAVAPPRARAAPLPLWPIAVSLLVLLVGFGLACVALAAWLLHARLDPVSDARTELVGVVVQERGLLRDLASAGADAEALADAWQELERTGSADAAARLAERIVAERHLLPAEAEEAEGARRVGAALEAWRRAEACPLGCD